MSAKAGRQRPSRQQANPTLTDSPTAHVPNLATSRDNVPPASATHSRSPPSAAKNLQHVPCKFFRSGQCTAGRNCIFSHATDADERIPCKYFQKGNCRFGAKCALAHILPDGRRVNAPPKQEPQSPLQPAAPAPLDLSSKAMYPNGGLSIGRRIVPEARHYETSGLNSLFQASTSPIAMNSPSAQSGVLQATQIAGKQDLAQMSFQRTEDETEPNASHRRHSWRPVLSQSGSFTAGLGHFGNGSAASLRETSGVGSSPPISFVPPRPLGPLDAQLPASLDTNGLSYYARYGPVAASVPHASTFARPQNSSSSNNMSKQIHGSSTGQQPSGYTSSAFASGPASPFATSPHRGPSSSNLAGITSSDGRLLGAGATMIDSNGIGGSSRPTMSPSLGASPRSSSLSMSRGLFERRSQALSRGNSAIGASHVTGAQDGSESDLFHGEEEEFVPSSLNELLTPAERQRRFSGVAASRSLINLSLDTSDVKQSSNQGGMKSPGATGPFSPPISSPHATNYLAASAGSPGGPFAAVGEGRSQGNSPSSSRFGALFQKHKERELIRSPIGTPPSSSAGSGIGVGAAPMERLPSTTARLGLPRVPSTLSMSTLAQRRESADGAEESGSSTIDGVLANSQKSRLKDDSQETATADCSEAYKESRPRRQDHEQERKQDRPALAVEHRDAVVATASHLSKETDASEPRTRRRTSRSTTDAEGSTKEGSVAGETEPFSMDM
ncbi:hypothetical protein PYCC9005_003793 [Savitreella phatthalungensis]